MSMVKRSSLAFVVLVAVMVGSGLGSWGVRSRGPATPPGSWSMPAVGQLAVALAAPPGPSASFAPVAEAVGPAVVNINSVTRFSGRTPIEEFFGDEFFRRFFGDVPGRQQVQRSLGSGVIVDPSGIVLTNAHVVERATDIEVTTADGKKHKAKVVGTDPKTDLAVLKLQGGGPYPAANLGDSDRVKVGDWVLAIGSPFGLQQTVTARASSAPRAAPSARGPSTTSCRQTPPSTRATPAARSLICRARWSASTARSSPAPAA